MTKSHSVAEAAIRYHVSHKTIYKWPKRYDGSLESLKDWSRRPYHMPNEQSKQEEKWVKGYVKQYGKDFLECLVKLAPFPIRLVQTDNGAEITNSLICVKSKHKSLFETVLEEIGILYKRIRIATPRHSGKIERKHRIDAERFYSKMRMLSLEDGLKQLSTYQAKSNHHIRTCLGMRSPLQVLADYQSIM